MTKTRPDDEMLWEMSRQTGETRGFVPPDEVLRAYHAGELPEADRVKLEVTLATSAAARRRLAEFGGIDLDYVPDGVRESLFGDRNGGTRASGSAWRLAASIALAVVVGVGGYQLLDSEREAPVPIDVAPIGEPSEGSTEGANSIAASDFTVSVRGAAGDRSGSGGAEAYPTTRVRIEVADELGQAGEFEAAIYRAAGEPDGDRTGNPMEEQLARVDEGIERSCYQGACVLAGLARDITGSDREGRHRFWILVAPAGDLPPTLSMTGAARGRKMLESELNLMAER